MLKNLKWYEFVLLLSSLLIALFLLADAKNSFITYAEISNFYPKSWNIKSPFNQIILTLFIQFILLFSVLLYLKKVNLSWYTILISSAFNIYVASSTLLNNHREYMTYFLMPEMEFNSGFYYNQFFEAILVIVISIACFILLFIPTISKKFNVNLKGIIIGLCITIIIIGIHYYMGYRPNRYGVWGADY